MYSYQEKELFGKLLYSFTMVNNPNKGILIIKN